MLILSRKVGETVAVGDALVIVLGATKSRVKLGFVAPEEIKVLRTEIEDVLTDVLLDMYDEYQRIQKHKHN